MDFNGHGDVLHAPFSWPGHFSCPVGLAVGLTTTGCKTQGTALIETVRVLDPAARQAHRIERVSQTVIDETLRRPMTRNC